MNNNNVNGPRTPHKKLTLKESYTYSSKLKELRELKLHVLGKATLHTVYGVPQFDNTNKIRGLKSTCTGLTGRNSKITASRLATCKFRLAPFYKIIAINLFHSPPVDSHYHWLGLEACQTHDRMVVEHHRMSTSERHAQRSYQA